jgi:N-acyl-D-aspartate/D-glutamate deacylase
MLDLVIRAASVVDGSGAPRFTADVGVKDARVMKIGRIDEPAAEELDADGLVLSPGFVDIHTHYDAQVFWDGALTPSPLHGVTTVMSGNCGFTLAPVRPGDVDYLSGMLSRVEGMPRASLEAGVPWGWSSVGDYLGAVEALGVVPNIGFLAGHSTLRRIVMGERSGEQATELERDAIARELDRALADGALGLSTSSSGNHSDESRHPVPSRCADDAELMALSRVVGGRPGTYLQCVPPSGPYDDATKDRMVAMSLAADRPINWNVIFVNAASADVAANRLEACDRGAQAGACITGLVFPTLNRITLNFATGFYIETLPGWSELFRLPVAERLRALADPQWRHRLRDGAAQVRPDQAFATRWPEYETGGATIGELAAKHGSDPFDTLLDVVVDSRLKAALTLPADADDESGWRLRGELCRDPRLLVGGSDAGAHLDMMCGAEYTTSMLQQFPARGLMDLESVVHQLTGAPSRLLGLRDRGRIAVGAWADLVCFDPDQVRPNSRVERHDLPGEASRVFADASGIRAVWINGVRAVDDGELLAGRPGRVLRSGTDTDTVSNRHGLMLTGQADH